MVCSAPNLGCSAPYLGCSAPYLECSAPLLGIAVGKALAHGPVWPLYPVRLDRFTGKPA